MSTQLLRSLPTLHREGASIGVTSVCSAHPEVIRAALSLGRHMGQPVLIEATCNQVNQDGGYTGMTPSGFRSFVETIADETGFDRSGLILGGDHLGPNPWKNLPAEQALDKARKMVAAYAEAGFEKIHLDCSMGCKGEPLALDDEATAARAADLCAIAEAHSPVEPVYIIGTEVPVPGGALEEVEHLQVTSPEAALTTVDIHRNAFAARNLQAAFERVVGLVVQPGVEFGNQNVVGYVPEAAQALSASLARMPNLVFEAHSTDYQTLEALSALVRDGFSILKVGPGLTFALREALYGLDLIAAELDNTAPQLKPAMEMLMQAEPGYWANYYPGSPDEQRIQRHFSYSDRIRYYWTHATAQKAVGELFIRLGDRSLPETLISQHLANAWPEVMTGQTQPTAMALAQAAVTRVLRTYALACGHGTMQGLQKPD
ncbi:MULTISPECIES: D-tagatose-bisphosphate aldolase, class II, non-catalytic subunit [unclassified Rhizobium]|uniref:D-tagatose-bisphosphate aldolase, class II, non-catalytic subunit n=1 Tax=unclassified Rhizobium TaxID=2613769 RepID=UPI00071230F1|nr:MULTISPECIES: D-tagatose-bisphosphate aldolase, class II, non-catalytic subunit [unclassified Rhizobium]KQS82340.1 tagatose-bisphosphate aldolase [Rhizobium sp. Leaf386]KQU03407.1 tagatose-bisphosphate aldolase [Rhizobium sp. Leaf453]